ncbi:MAG: deoxyribodipyrimidine photo-lyase [Chitinophagaceae bacterium]|nr:deoxyribodipyrimidine photo-lyase [Chitinophagaceae bacterium]
MRDSINIFWFRRDLRLYDNAGLYHALKSDRPVLPLFIFDRNILDKLDEKADARVQFIRDTLVEMQKELDKRGTGLEVHYGFPEEVFQQLLSKYEVGHVYTNHDYEPYARQRDEGITKLLAKAGVSFSSFKDQVIFDRDEVLKDDGTPYTVFTPYSKRWKALLNDFYLRAYPVEKYEGNFCRQKGGKIPSLSFMGFKSSTIPIPSRTLKRGGLEKYKEQRDFPGIEGGTSRMGVHLRFGTVSVRELGRKAAGVSEVYLNELIWRDFFHMILWHFPAVGKGKSFRPAYDLIRWRNSEQEFEKWCQGQTGYPIVDAGMRELNATGFMHNRVRMIVASFLVKHLLIDWRWGEAYFAEKLLDYDLASNNGNWQWAAGCGCDAAPYFRVFNPSLQTEKFDPDLRYIRKWVPELDGFDYPPRVVEHEAARKRALEVYGRAVKEKVGDVRGK